ncbi:hypothetical protein [Sulfurimonas sp. C5]|uniref:DUF4139 domain-containing protein n=1 Tax=Sulfurimonas sp. C5 TaxID=3036947 RepID=UPI002455DF23|nr:hypothetical protein [Sulfurimonas sp. C5]
MKIATSLLLFTSVCFGATLSHQPTSSSLVIYNNNKALVNETRELSLQKNDTEIVYDNVASTIHTDSVNIKLPSGVSLTSQQYRYDKLSVQKMLEVYLNKEVRVKLSEHRHINATLLSANAPFVLVKSMDNEIIPVKFENIIFKDFPENFITTPSLIWNVKTKKDLHDNVELDYLISNISFNNSYTLNIEKDSSELDGWFNIDNRSGKSFKNSSLAFLAGDVNFVQNPTPIAYKTMATLAESDMMPQEQSFSGYHYYKLPFKVNLPNNEKTQIKFLSLPSLKIAREYISTVQNPLYLHGEQKSSVMQEVSFQNGAQVLPKGVVRVYGKLDGQKILLGESNINHTPKNETLHLGIGKEFDLEVMQTLLQRDEQKHHISSAIQYSVKNSSKEEKTVTLRIPFYKERSAKVYSKEKYTYTKGNLVTFILPVKANTTKKFTVKFEKNR